MKNARVGLCPGLQIGLCCLAIAVATFAAYLYSPAELHYAVVERYTFSNPDQGSALYLGVLIPVSGPYQRVDGVQILWEGDIEREVMASGEVIRMVKRDIAMRSFSAQIRYDIVLQRGKTNWESPVEESHTAPQFGIESDDQELATKATQLTQGSSLEDVKRIYHFVAENIDYFPLKENWAMSTASDTYKSRSGICTGIARLMVALCRAAHIPSQVVHGIILPDMFMTESISTGEAHAWVEFYAGGEWGMADPTWGSGINRNLQFNHSDGFHISYGEFDQERWDVMDLAYWAASSANWLEMENGFKKYVVSSTSQMISIQAEKTILKEWDSRWVSVALTWGGTTLMALGYRNRFLLPRQQRQDGATPLHSTAAAGPGDGQADGTKHQINCDNYHYPHTNKPV